MKLTMKLSQFSGLLAPFSPSGEIIRMVSGGNLALLYDARVLLEYEEVLNRPKFKFNKEHINTLLDFIKTKWQVCFAHASKDVSAGP